jgi:hypothetical protein
MMERPIPLVFAVALIGWFIAPSPAPAADESVARELEAIRADMTQLKRDMKQAVDQYQINTSTADADATPKAAPVDPEVARRLEQLIKNQQALEQRIENLIDSQRRLEQAVAPVATTQAQTVRSPFEYRYQTQPTTQPRTTTTTTVTTTRTDPAPPANATYTTYNNGYTSQTYVPPTVVSKTAGPVIYAPAVTRVYYSSYPRIYRPYYHHRKYYHKPYYRHYGYHHHGGYSGATIGVRTGNFFFKYNTGYRGYCW